MNESTRGAELLDGALSEILESFPLGLSEYDLILELKKRTDLISDRFGGDNLLLFRTHFTLFNALYRLKDRMEAGGERTVEIGPLNIRLRELRNDEESDALVDAGEEKLKAYYLDMDNLTATTKEDVEGMLGQFWEMYRAQGGRQSALKVLDLADPVDDATIRRRYRALARRHHPDRGGDKARLQEINAAMETLKKGKSS